MDTLADRPGLLNRLRSGLHPRNLAGGVRHIFGRLVETPAPVLGNYVAPRAPLRDRLRKIFWISLIAFVGMVYGFMVVIFPMHFYQYMAMPIALIVLLVIWILPDTGKAPLRLMTWFFWASFFGLFLWPNYLAIALPGLPWITMVRVWNLPMVALLLISLSVSSAFRGQLKAIFAESKLISWLMAAFMALQFITLPFSAHVGDSLNRAISNLFEWGGVFIVACLVFSTQGSAQRWVRSLCLMALFLAFLSFFEWREQQVLWANHIPWFLVVADEAVQRMLAGTARAATGIYRLQSIFSTSLNFAELLGLTTVFFIHAIVKAKSNIARAALIAYIPWHFWTIWCTDSRLGMVAFYGSLLAYPFLWGIRRWRVQTRDIVAPALVLAYPAIIAVFFTVSLFWQRLNRMIWGGGAQQASNAAREAQWAAMWPKLGKWPFGHGPSQSGEALGYTNSEGTVTIDSYYITIAMEYGVIGFFVFYGLLAAAIYQAYKLSAAAEDEETQLLLPVAIAILMFFIVKGVLSQEDSHAMIFMLIGMVVALTYRMKSTNHHGSPSVN